MDFKTILQIGLHGLHLHRLDRTARTRAIAGRRTRIGLRRVHRFGRRGAEPGEPGLRARLARRLCVHRTRACRLPSCVHELALELELFRAELRDIELRDLVTHVDILVVVVGEGLNGTVRGRGDHPRGS